MPLDDNGNPFYVAEVRFTPEGRTILARTYSQVDVGVLTPSGQADTTFGGTGARTYPATNSASWSTLALQSDGKLLLAGSHSSGSSLLRLLADGSPDPTFPTRNYLDGASIARLAIDTQGRIVGSGSIGGNVALRRWLPSGDDDKSLQGTGRITTTLSGWAWSLQLLANTKALVRYDRDKVARLGSSALEDSREFVRQQYRDFLGREGDETGVESWNERLASGAISRAALVEQFFASPEFQASIAPVVRLYFAYFLRYPDHRGLQFWVSHSRANSLHDISAAFATSDEFTQRYGTLDNRGFVELVYQNVLGRGPDADGAAYWRGQLDSGAMNRGQVMVGLSESTEFRSVSSNEVYVTMAYAGLLRREPEPDGFRYWLGYMDGGNTRIALIDQVLGSQEYRDRFRS